MRVRGPLAGLFAILWLAATGAGVPVSAAAAGEVQWGLTTTPTEMVVHTTTTAQVTFTNSGPSTWMNQGAAAVSLGYHWYSPAGAVVVEDGLRTHLPAPVAPGSTTTITAQILPPNSAGPYQLRFDLLRGDAAWLSATGSATLAVSVLVHPADYDVSWAPVTATVMAARSTVEIPVTATNVGRHTWVASGSTPVHLSYHWQAVGNSGLSTYDGLRTSLPGDVVPGDAITVAAAVRSPDAPGAYTLSFDLVEEGVSWFSNLGSATASAQVQVGAPAFDASWVSVPAALSGAAREAMSVDITLTNSGTTAWSAGGADPVRVSYHLFNSDGTLLTWDGARTPLVADVAPGSSVKASPVLYVPDRSGGSFRVEWDLVREGTTWLSGTGATLPTTALTVGQPIMGVVWDAVPTVLQMRARETTVIPVTLTNAGAESWPPAGGAAVQLAYHWLTPAGNMVLWDGLRTPLATAVAPGDTTRVVASVTAPGVPGQYRLVWDLLQQGRGWFSVSGAQTGWSSVDVGLPAYAVRWRLLQRPPLSLPARSAFRLTVSVTNDGAFAWDAGGTTPVRVAYHWMHPDGTVALWDGERSPLPHDLRSGSSSGVQVDVAAPDTPGDYELELDLIRVGAAWFSSTGASTNSVRFRVTTALLDAAWGRCEAPPAVAVGGADFVSIKATNIGAARWDADGANAVSVSYHWDTLESPVVVSDGLRTPLPSTVLPGQTVQAEMAIRAPDKPGRYLLVCDLLQEDTGWFGAQGSLVAQQSVDVVVVPHRPAPSSTLVSREPTEVVTAAPPASPVVFATSGAAVGLTSGSLAGIGYLVSRWGTRRRRRL